MSKRKNVSNKVKNGSILMTRDEYLESGVNYNKPNYENRGNYRKLSVIDSNDKDELVGVKLSTKGKHILNTYKDGRSKYSAFVETKDNEGNPIKVDGIKFIKKPKKDNLNKKEVNQIKRDCFSNHNTSAKVRKNNKCKVRKLKGRE